MLSTKIIGQRIADARKKTTISQAQLSERLFISPQAVGKWERGESMPDIITLNRLSEILDVDLNYFSDGFTSAVSEEKKSSNSLQELLEKPKKSEKKLNWDMSRGNWLDADFSGLKGLNEKFSSSNMQRCKFISSDLSGLILKGNNIDRCDFSNSDFSHSSIQGSHLSGNLFKNCSLVETEFSGSHIIGGDFSGANFTGAIIKAGGIENSILENTTWKDTSFSLSYIADLVFTGTLKDCSFENCAFKRVTFQDAILTNTFFKNKSLKQIKFINCQADRITYEFLKNGKADLSGIQLVMV
ncbi:pentapeptide repeat-containing protein [Fluviicola taffensis]|uniref:Helix-turn-helix domain protein n=1 Tax=Fluviicola taffensis (strain DSM 16823 / NCIMB 13979 / RW262) TaxID=755732 RepID=F2IFL6_FLUTR|nr:pentapeptide repeat-containing protein [Fluviicola taffensis]AEA45730.1 helix-turn-helix domain protein [Fluviicola taffensis DSM 16823]